MSISILIYKEDDNESVNNESVCFLLGSYVSLFSQIGNFINEIPIFSKLIDYADLEEDYSIKGLELISFTDEIKYILSKKNIYCSDDFLAVLSKILIFLDKNKSESWRITFF